MENKKLGQEPAYPCEIGFENGNIQEMHQNGNYTALHNGMSKRFYAACAAMQGLLSNSVGIKAISDNVDTQEEFFSEVIKSSYDFADELLKQENA